MKRFFICLPQLNTTVVSGLLSICFLDCSFNKSRTILKQGGFHRSSFFNYRIIHKRHAETKPVNARIVVIIVQDLQQLQPACIGDAQDLLPAQRDASSTAIAGLGHAPRNAPPANVHDRCGHRYHAVGAAALSRLRMGNQRPDLVAERRKK